KPHAVAARRLANAAPLFRFISSPLLALHLIAGDLGKQRKTALENRSWSAVPSRMALKCSPSRDPALPWVEIPKLLPTRNRAVASTSRCPVFVARDLSAFAFSSLLSFSLRVSRRRRGSDSPEVESQFGSQISAKRTNLRLVVGLGGPVN